MRYLCKDWGVLKDELRNAFLFIFLDYDGTLVPIAETPDKARLAPKTKSLLQGLSGIRSCKLALISGRALKDIKRTVGLKDIIYAGNHGLEVQGPKIRFKHKVGPRLRSKIQGILYKLKTRLSKIKGVFVEDKGLSLSLHYRLADKKDISFVKSVLSGVVRDAKVKDILTVKAGKKVFDIRPAAGWDKGKAVLWLLRRFKTVFKDRKVFSVYLGDDSTDEDAFKALRAQGMTIFVGQPKRSYARYYLKDTKEVLGLLEQILELKRGVSLCQNS